MESDRIVRLGPRPEGQWDDRTRAALAALLPPERRNPRGAGNALATLARHPDLAEAFLPFNTRLLLRSTLPPRLRELRQELAGVTFKEYALQDANTLEATPGMLKSRAVTEFPLCDQEILLRHLHKATADYLKEHAGAAR